MSEHQSKTPSKVLRHVVLFAFKDTSTPQQVQVIEKAFCDLPNEIDEIYDFEWGTNVSVENIAQGFTHCFLVTFLGEKDRDAYLIHAVHQDFVSNVQPHLAKALVVDYWVCF